jgi:hypothetical protein
MSASFTLDAIRDAAEKKYGATEIVVDEHTTVRLLNPLRLKKERRDALTTMQETLTDEGVDQVAVFGNAIRLVADNEDDANRLLEIVGDDLAMLAEIFRTYGAGTGLGEASASVD